LSWQRDAAACGPHIVSIRIKGIFMAGMHEGKVAIVTGGARGIGRAVSERLAREGAQIVIADIDDTAEQVVDDITKRGGTARFIHCDVGERLDVRNLIADTLDGHDTIDILVNNAGIVHATDFLDLDEADFDRVLRVNLKGPFLVGQAVARQMVKQIESASETTTPVAGSIVNMSSINAVYALPNQVAYSVSKGGLSQLTKVMALALAPHGIRVNAVGPGSIMTEMLESVLSSDAEARDKVLSRTPIGRIGETSEIAAVVSFLASTDASYITGQTVYADGGRLGLNYTVPVPEDD
jgi:glucose 1-dehydrogenase